MMYPSPILRSSVLMMSPTSRVSTPPRALPPFRRLNQNILLPHPLLTHNPPRRLLQRLPDPLLLPTFRIIMQGTLLAVRSRYLKVSVVDDIFPADVALEVTTGTDHFIASLEFNEWFLAFVAFLKEGCCHCFFDDVLRGEFVLFCVFYEYQQRKNGKRGIG